MKKVALVIFTVMMLFVWIPGTAEYGYYGTDSYTDYAYMPATLNQRLATRTGPGTRYDEPGSFLGAGYSVAVLSKAYDASNEIWWVQVEFSDGGAIYRAYTGAKRFDRLDLSVIPEERLIGRCRIGTGMTGYYGPSYYYQPISRAVPAGVSCDIYGYAYGDDADFIQIEFYDAGINQYRRAWVPDWSVDDYEMYYGF